MSHSSHLQALHTGARYSFLILVITHYQLARVGLLPHISARVSMVVTEGFPFSRVGLRVDRHTPEFALALLFLQKPSWFFLGYCQPNLCPPTAVPLQISLRKPPVEVQGAPGLAAVTRPAHPPLLHLSSGMSALQQDLVLFV